MLINVDVKSLEVVVAAQLSGDKVLKKEIIDKLDTHADNQAKFNLPDRLTAKRFVFKLLFGATHYGFYTDPDFLEVGLSQEQWAEVIRKFYEKYSGIAAWHKKNIHEAMLNGKLSVPSGAYYPFAPKMYERELKWPITQIKNYPIQGFGADLVMLARLECSKLLKKSGLEYKLVSTVHDSIVVDTPEKNTQEVAKILKQSVESVPALCKQVWNYDFDIPLSCEVQAGKNKFDMEDVLC